MKKFYLFITGLLLATIVFSQDAVYLNNGSMIKGKIIEQVPNEQIKIKTRDGSIFVYKFSEVEKITKETDEINLDDYGGKFSCGVAIGGGGIVGIPVRTYISPKLALELGVFYRPAVILYTGGYYSADHFNSIVLAGGPNIYLKKKLKKNRIKLNGITIKGGIGFGDFSTYMLGGGWIHEKFYKRNKNRSFSVELGPCLIVTDNLPAEYYEIFPSPVAIYWKLQWSFYRK